MRSEDLKGQLGFSLGKVQEPNMLIYMSFPTNPFIAKSIGKYCMEYACKVSWGSILFIPHSIPDVEALPPLISEGEILSYLNHHRVRSAMYTQFSYPVLTKTL